MRRALALAACLAPLLAAQHWSAAPAYGATMTLTSAAPPAIYKPAKRAVDVAGIAPGMDPEAVRAILVKLYGDVRVTHDNLGLENEGVVAATQAYVTQMSARKDRDAMDVWFGTPTTGNAVVEISRQTTYPDPAAAPDLAQVQAELVAKYGPPSFSDAAAGSGEVSVLAWAYGGDKQVPCARSACRADVSEGPQVDHMNDYRRAVRSGRHLTILATLLGSLANANKAASVVLTVSDVATKLRTLDAAIGQMRAATSGTHEKAAERAAEKAARGR